jgi:hypothetical protein
MKSTLRQSNPACRLIVSVLTCLMLSVMFSPAGVMAMMALPPTGSIGDFVWNDMNRNGIQDAGEPGIDVVTVKLFSLPTPALLAQTATSPNGFYLFSGLLPGDYLVEFTLPAGYSFTLADQGGDDARDSDVFSSLGRTAGITLFAGQNNHTIDAGMYTSNAVAPLPGTILLLGSGLFSIMVLGRKLKT